jgi:hypothetical protein
LYCLLQPNDILILLPVFLPNGSSAYLAFSLWLGVFGGVL